VIDTPVEDADNIENEGQVQVAVVKITTVNIRVIVADEAEIVNMKGTITLEGETLQMITNVGTKMKIPKKFL